MSREMSRVNVTGPVNQLGYGLTTVNTIAAMERAGYAPAAWFIGSVEAQPEYHETLRRVSLRTQLYNPLAPSLRIYHQNDLAQHVGKGVHAAMPIFELTRFNKVELHHLQSQDKLIVNSKWAAGILVQNGVPKEKVSVSPLGVDVDVFQSDEYDLKPANEKTAVGAPTVFLNCGKWELRKGHHELLQAFNKAFEPTDNVRLVMNCYNPCQSAKIRNAEDSRRYNEDWTRAYKTSKMGEKIQVVAERLPSQKDVAALMSYADCCVFPSRAEGFNLEAAEALAMGKHVILTYYSAHTEYANRDNSLLIDIDALEEAYDGHWFVNTGTDVGQWAALGDAQLDQLIYHMRNIHRAKQGGELGPNLNGIASMRSFTWDATVRSIASVLSLC